MCSSSFCSWSQSSQHLYCLDGRVHQYALLIITLHAVIDISNSYKINRRMTLVPELEFEQPNKVTESWLYQLTTHDSASLKQIVAI